MIRLLPLQKIYTTTPRRSLASLASFLPVLLLSLLLTAQQGARKKAPGIAMARRGSPGLPLCYLPKRDARAWQARSRGKVLSSYEVGSPSSFTLLAIWSPLGHFLCWRVLSLDAAPRKKINIYFTYGIFFRGNENFSSRKSFLIVGIFLQFLFLEEKFSFAFFPDLRKKISRAPTPPQLPVYFFAELALYSLRGI